MKNHCRKDSFITHRAFCDALAEESARLSANLAATPNPLIQTLFPFPTQQSFQTNNISWDPRPHQNPNPNNNNNNNQSLAVLHIKPETDNHHFPIPSFSSPPPAIFHEPPRHNHNKGFISSPFQNLNVTTQPTSNAATSAHLSATALLQKAATMGATAISGPGPASVAQHPHQSVSHMTQFNTGEFGTLNQLDSLDHVSVTDYTGGGGGGGGGFTWHKSNDRLTRDFLGLTGDANGGKGGRVNVSVNLKDMLTYAGGVEYNHPPYIHRQQAFGFAETTATASEAWGDW